MTDRPGWRIVALLLALGAIAPSAHAELEVPFLAGRVNDLADMLPPDAESRIEARLERLETERGAQVAVLTIPTLEGEVLEDYSLRVAETWKLGRGEFDDGVLLLIARDDRKMRLEVGYGLEPAITDLASRRILDDVIRPRFRQGDFSGGIVEGVEVVAGLVEGEDALPPPGAKPAGRPRGLQRFFGFLATVGFFSFLAVGSRGCVGWLLFALITPFWFAIPLSIWGRPFGFVPGAVWVVAFPVLWAWLGRTSWGGRWTGSGGGWSSSGGSWGGFSGGGFSGGGFSGGGGSFGGGGSSGSW